MEDVLLVGYTLTESGSLDEGNLNISLNLKPLASTPEKKEEDLKTCMADSDGVILFHNEIFTKIEKDFSQWPLHGSSTVGGISYFEILRICEKSLNRKF